MSKELKAIIIDDDSVNNRIVQLSLSRYGNINDVRDFTSATDALEFISNFRKEDFNSYPTIILLDINMPIMNGWLFLEEYDKLDENIKFYYKIYMLSSSIDWNDIELSKTNKNVYGYFVKPLLQDKVISLINDIEPLVETDIEPLPSSKEE